MPGDGLAPDVELITERLLLRRWRDSDRAPFAQLNADVEVMRHFPAPLTRDASDAMVDRIDASFGAARYGLYVVERRAEGDFIGFVGLAAGTFEAPFTPAVEIGCRLARHAWGHGYATEAARAVVAHAFGPARADRARLVHRARQHAVTARDGAHRDDARPRRGLRPSTRARGPSAVPARAVPSAPHG